MASRVASTSRVSNSHGVRVSCSDNIQHIDNPTRGSLVKMRLVKQNIDKKTMAGSATLTPEEPEDMVSKSVSTLAVEKQKDLI